jgi:hypothetical protein
MHLFLLSSSGWKEEERIHACIEKKKNLKLAAAPPLVPG